MLIGGRGYGSDGTDGRHPSTLFRLIAISAIVAGALAIAPVGSARAAAQVDAHGKPFSCPDPSIADVPQFGSSGGRYVEACTTDMDRDAISLYRSDGLRGSWRAIGYVFPVRRQPWWAVRSTGNLRGGRFWSPEIHWIDNRWVVYFAATPRKSVIRGGGGAFVIGVAWSHSLRGPWSSKVLHWRGQFNSLGGDRETYGSVIDPSAAQNPYTKQRYLYWAIQHTSIWGAALSQDGLTLSSDVHLVLWAQRQDDCDSNDPRSCCVEGPAAFFKEIDGTVWEYLVYSSRSTWHGTYEMWAAAATDPLGYHSRLGTRPILRSGNGWWGPGGGSGPVSSPDGRSLWIPYHATGQRLNRHDRSWERLAFIGPVTWVDPPPSATGADKTSALPIPLIDAGLASSR